MDEGLGLDPSGGKKYLYTKEASHVHPDGGSDLNSLTKVQFVAFSLDWTFTAYSSWVWIA